MSTNRSLSLQELLGAASKALFSSIQKGCFCDTDPSLCDNCKVADDAHYAVHDRLTESPSLVEAWSAIEAYSLAKVARNKARKAWMTCRHPDASYCTEWGEYHAADAAMLRAYDHMIKVVVLAGDSIAEQIEAAP